ncbi:MAG: hypothetical protein JXL97_18425 [Bacteroidales bacterium]|nr:hypothetical protein [Bacteroidales bacterium]
MEIINITSKNELLENLAKNKNNYVLIYKAGSEQSECAYTNLKATEDIDGIKVFGVNVAEVRDVHTYYFVTSAPTLLHFEGDKMIKPLKGCDKPDFYKSLFQNSLFVVENNNSEKPQKRVTVYSTPSCSWCTRLKNYFDQHKIKYRDIDVSKDTKAAEEMVKKSGQQGVPQTDISGQIIVGFDKPKIDRLLGIKN